MIGEIYVKGVSRLSEQREHTCCFTGHRHISAEKLPKVIESLDIELGWLISHGITEFYTGGALGFDTISALAVLKAKRTNERIGLHLALPCPEQTKFWRSRDVEIYNYILSRADSIEYLSDHYHRGAMQLRNRRMVDSSRYCVCYYDNETASEGHGKGTVYTVDYARRSGLTIINLCDEPPDDGQIEFSF